tara:strand:- start:612 stop:1202 length:591 start_codon:yes stop_codon:yes gene_type:complete
MKYKLIISILLLFQGCATTKVFQPNQIPVSPRVGFLEDVTIDLAIFDGRVINEFSFEIINQISNQLKKTYPSAKFNILPSNQFYKDPVSGRITIKIALASYDAGFGSNITVVTVGTFGGDFGYGIIPEGKWNGITGFSINIYDGRNNNSSKVTKNIGNVVSLPNMWGYKTARNALDKSYKQSMQELLFFIDNSLMK